MKQLWLRLSSRWFALMVPVSGPLNTLEARETLRKRRLFSCILLIASLTGIFSAIQYSLNGTSFSRPVSIISSCITLCALWINQRGHVEYLI